MDSYEAKINLGGYGVLIGDSVEVVLRNFQE